MSQNTVEPPLDRSLVSQSTIAVSAVALVTLRFVGDVPQHGILDAGFTDSGCKKDN